MGLVENFLRGETAFQVEDCSDSGKKAVPLRPALPPVFLIAICAWISCYFVYKNAVNFSIQQCVIMATVSIGLVGLIFVFNFALTKSISFKLGNVYGAVICIAVGILLGAAFAGAHGAKIMSSAQPFTGAYSEECTVIVQEDSSVSTFGSVCSVTAVNNSGQSVDVSLSFPSEIGQLRYAEKYSATLKFSQVSEKSKEYAWERGSTLKASTKEMTLLPATDFPGAIGEFRKNAISTLEPYANSGAVFLRALLFGDKTQLKQSDLYQDVKTVGLAHIVAVSGAHLSVICMLLGSLLCAINVPKKTLVCIQVVFIATYLVCTGMPVSALRAAMMSVVVIAAAFSKRRASSLNALGVCLLLIIGLSANSSMSISLMLSAGATAGIIVLAPLIEYWCNTAVRKMPTFVSESTSLTLSSGVIATPISAAVFSQMPLIGILSNIVAAPFFAVLCAGGLCVVVLATLCGELMALPVAVLVFVAQLFCDLVSIMARIPFACIPVSVNYGLAICVALIVFGSLWIFWPHPKSKHLRLFGAIVLAGLLLFALKPAANSADKLIALDIGQGDALIVQSNNNIVLIDTGKNDSMLLSALAQNSISRLDAVIITHNDLDHYGSLEALEGVVPIKEIYLHHDDYAVNDVKANELRNTANRIVGAENMKSLSLGDVISVGDVDLEVIWPDKYKDDGGNADSLSVMLSADVNSDGNAEATAFLGGDAEIEEMEEMISSGNLGDVDIYKVAHHGSRNGTNEEIAHELMPEISIVSCGLDNSYGHPAQNVLDALNGVNSKILRTDLQGSVTCEFTPEGIKYSTQFG